MKFKFFLTILYGFLFINSLEADSGLRPCNSFFEESILIQNVNHDCFFEILGWPWWENKEKVEEKENKPLNVFDIENLAGLEKKLKERIVGQDHAIQQTVAVLERYALNLHDPDAPIGSLLYVGPTSVGKTQLAKELARNLLGGEHRLIRFNMSEFSEAWTIYRLIGIEGGQFTEALKKNPNTIVLLDEIEKAHPKVLKYFLQIFDEGFITDSKGEMVDCRNSLFILTTNIEGQRILTMHEVGHTNQEIFQAIQPRLIAELSSEFYNRIEPVVFRGLRDSIVDDLISKMLFQAFDELMERKSLQSAFDPSVLEFLRKRAANYSLGARPIKQMIKQTVITAITNALTSRYLNNGDSFSISFQHNQFIIANGKEEKPFSWKWIDEEIELSKPPFKLDDLLTLQDKLESKILGQSYAIKITVAALMRFAAGFISSKSPIGTFLYVGPTGVGKTQMAKELAVELLGSEKHMIRLDMSEYSEAHSISKLIGSPPGYVNHEEGGQLTEALKQHPYTIVLLDEIEKAHPVVLKTFLQAFDEGRLSDAKGSVIDCKNAIFILTTNLAANKILTMHEEGYSEDQILKNIQKEIIQVISPELYNRLEVAPFMGLGDELLEQLILNMLNELKNEIYLLNKIKLIFDPTLIEFLQSNGYHYELGARPLRRLIQQTVVTTLAQEIISKNIFPGDSLKISYLKERVVIERELVH